MKSATALGSLSVPAASAQAFSLSGSSLSSAISFSRSHTVFFLVNAPRLPLEVDPPDDELDPLDDELESLGVLVEVDAVVVFGTSVGGVNGLGPGSDAF